MKTDMNAIRLTDSHESFNITKMPDQIRVVLVDDHEVIRESWNLLLSSDGRFDIVAVCKNGQEALEKAEQLLPDVMLMDINMWPINGFETTQRISQQFPSIRVIGISANNYAGYADKILDMGGKGFVTKSSPFDELTNAIVTVNDGGRYVCDEIKNGPGR